MLSLWLSIFTYYIESCDSAIFIFYIWYHDKIHGFTHFLRWICFSCQVDSSSLTLFGMGLFDADRIKPWKIKLRATIARKWGIGLKLSFNSLLHKKRNRFGVVSSPTGTLYFSWTFTSKFMNLLAAGYKKIIISLGYVTDIVNTVYSFSYYW